MLLFFSISSNGFDQIISKKAKNNNFIFIKNPKKIAEKEKSAVLVLDISNLVFRLSNRRDKTFKIQHLTPCQNDMSFWLRHGVAARLTKLFLNVRFICFAIRLARYVITTNIWLLHVCSFKGHW